MSGAVHIAITFILQLINRVRLLTNEACEVSVVRGKGAVSLYRDACEKPFGDNLQLGGWAWLQTHLFTVLLHAAALPLLAAPTPLPFTEEELPSPQPKYSSRTGHSDVGSSYTEFYFSLFCFAP